MKRILLSQEDCEQGIRGKAESCALARAIKREFPAEKVFISPYYALVDGIDFSLCENGIAFVRAADQQLELVPCEVTLTEIEPILV